jgi:ethanolamine ammonia-lyase large subunit
VIGINPATDSLAPQVIRLVGMLDEIIQRYGVPTPVVRVDASPTRWRRSTGAPVDLVFRSIAGTETANRGFGIDLKLLGEAHSALALSLSRGSIGNNVMYFETGRGGALSNSSHYGVDQQTCEARTRLRRGPSVQAAAGQRCGRL